MSKVLRQELHSFKKRIVMKTSKQSHFLWFSAQIDSRVHKATHQVHCDKSKSTSKSHPIQSRVITKGNHESTDWFDQSRGLFWKLSGWEFTSEMNEWMMKTQMAMKSNQISYLKPMDWARLETFRGERIPRSGRNLGGASVRFFFLPVVRKVQSQIEWGSVNAGVKFGQLIWKKWKQDD